MTPLEFATAIFDLGAEYAPWVVMAFARPFGFALLFAVFWWSKLSVGVLRAAFALGISLPLLSSGLPTYGLEGLTLPIIPIILKELLIGAVLGLVCSIPLAIATGAGDLIDFYRGTFIGDPDPSGGQVTPYAHLFAVISLWLFAWMGGFWIVTDAIYRSYDVWSINAAFPTFDVGADVLLSLLEKVVLGALVLAGPLVALMFFIDVIFLVSAKFGKQINVTHLAFSTKNLVAAVALPFFLLVAIRVFKSDLDFIRSAVEFTQGIMR